MEILFPPDATLPIHRLAACFNSTSATYKFYWLLAILDAVRKQKREIKKEELFASIAWYTVNDIQNDIILRLKS